MLKNMLHGLAAGAVGTVTLNVMTYADMALRRRPSSDVPAQLVRTVADAVGLDLASGTDEAAQREAAHRASGLGALLGYATGLGMGALYGLLRPRLRRVSVPLAGVGLGLAAMAASDLPIAATGVSDPATWGATGWAADVIPHLGYGLLTAIAFEAFAGAPCAAERGDHPEGQGGRQTCHA